MWNYRIKVFPWVVFGIVKWRVRPVNIAVSETYAANLLSNQIVGHGPQASSVHAIGKHHIVE